MSTLLKLRIIQIWIQLKNNTINNNVIKIGANTKNMHIINHATLRLNDGVNNNLNAININQNNIQNNTNKIDN